MARNNFDSSVAAAVFDSSVGSNWAARDGWGTSGHENQMKLIDMSSNGIFPSVNRLLEQGAQHPSSVGPVSYQNASSNDDYGYDKTSSAGNPAATLVPMLVAPATHSSSAHGVGALPGFKTAAVISGSAEVSSAVNSDAMGEMLFDDPPSSDLGCPSEAGSKRSAAAAGLDAKCENESNHSNCHAGGNHDAAAESACLHDAKAQIRLWRERCFAAIAAPSSRGSGGNEECNNHCIAPPTLDETTSILGGSASGITSSGKHYDITTRPLIPAKQITAVMTGLRQQQLHKSRNLMDATSPSTGAGSASNLSASINFPSTASTSAGARTSARRKEQMELQLAKSAAQSELRDIDTTNGTVAADQVMQVDASPSQRQVEWVQCDACKKWRTLPAQSHPMYPKQLDEDKGWVCSMNLWAPHLASCAVPEESMLSATAVKIKVWLRRLRSGDRFDSKSRIGVASFPSFETRRSVLSAPLLRSSDVHWLRCGNPLCGKWRACIRSMSVNDIRTNEPFFCWMVSWDETRASCSAPQEGASVTSFAIAMADGDANEGSGVGVATSGNSSGGNSALTGGVSASGSVSTAASSSQRRGTGETGSSSSTVAGRGFGTSSLNSTNNNDMDAGANNTRGSGNAFVDGGASSNGSAGGGPGGHDPEEAEGDGDAEGDGAKTIGISSRGRIVRSKFNVRKHLVGSRK